MADLFDTLDAPTAAAEKGYVNNPVDPGGETNHGITIKVARQNGYVGPMRDMTAAQAKAIRRAIYYARPGIYLLAPISQRIATKVYDTGVNMGTGTAVMWFQRVLNLFNHRGKDYPDIAVDGAAGPKSAGALTAFLSKRPQPEGTIVFLTAFTALQDADYVTLAERQETNEDFIYGWLRARGQFPTS